MKYRKKPVVIEAVQWMKHGDHPEVIEGWTPNFCSDCRGASKSGQPIRCERHSEAHIPVIETLEGFHEVTVGDWIIKGVKGEFYPCKPDIFEATYELVE